MQYDKIPSDWQVGIKSIDEENQSLLNFLQAWQDDKVQSENNIKLNFTEFNDRFSNLLVEIKADMEKVGYRHFDYFKNINENALISLKNMHENKDENLIINCRKFLLIELVNTDLYYNIYKVNKVKEKKVANESIAA